MPYSSCKKTLRIRGLDLIQRDKNAIFKLLKDIDERLPSLAWEAKKSYTPKLITLFEMMQTPSLLEKTQETCTL